ncbi:MarR family winged helix-turn-helix transcriptional regulator [Chloroflexota bacterium]
MRNKAIEGLGIIYPLPIPENPELSPMVGQHLPFVLLYQVRDAMAKAIENEVRRFGVSFMRAAVLLVVSSIVGPATPTEISRWLFREPHDVSVLVARMEKTGLVRRVKDMERRNFIRVEITDKGEEVIQQLREMKVMQEIFTCITPEELENLGIYLWRLRNKAIEELGIIYQLPFPENPELSRLSRQRLPLANRFVSALFGRFLS